MNVDAETLEKELIEWVREWAEPDPGLELDANTNLLNSGLLDSMKLMGLIAYLEDRTGVQFDFGQFDPLEDSSIRGLVAHCPSA